MPTPKPLRKKLPAKSTLEAITPVPVEPESSAVANGKEAADLEARSLERKKGEFDLYERNEQLERRRIIGGRTFNLVSGWIYAVLVLLLLQGFGFHFHLSDTVLGVAIGSTTVNVIAMLVIVLKGIFPPPRK